MTYESKYKLGDLVKYYDEEGAQEIQVGRIIEVIFKEDWGDKYLTYYWADNSDGPFSETCILSTYVETKILSDEDFKERIIQARKRRREEAKARRLTT